MVLVLAFRSTHSLWNLISLVLLTKWNALYLEAESLKARYAVSNDNSTSNLPRLRILV